jgi:non-specific serine/threonine protein kinase
LVGRDEERRVLRELLAERRLVTLCGPGGVGKTRLALTSAWDVADWFTDGAALVELSGVADPLAVGGAIATSLGVPETTKVGPLDALLTVLARRELLLVLDNCEHVIDAVAELVIALLTRTANVRVMTTSREALRVGGEAAFPVEPLPIIDSAGAGGAGDAVELFITRAKDADYRFTLADRDALAAVELVRRVDGLPLAIEIVAAHTTQFSSVELLERMGAHPELFLGRGRGIAERHRSLHAAIEWSDALLTSAERAVLYRLSVFAGGCTLGSAERVCAALGDLTAANVADAMTSLVDKSVAVARPAPGGTRYHLLDTVRRYAAERLAAHGDSSLLRAAHLAWLIDLADEATSGLDGPARSECRISLEDEAANFAAGLGWAIEHDPPRALRLTTRLSGWWRTVGRLAEGRRWLEAALAANGSTAPVEICAAMLELGLVLQDQGDVVGSFSVHRQALAAAESIGDAELITQVAIGMANVLRDSGEYAAAAGFAGRALDLARERLDSRGQVAALAALAFVDVYGGAPDRARVRGEEAVRLLDDKDTSEVAWNAIASAAIANCFAGELDPAEAHANRALDLAVGRGSPFQRAWAHSTLGAIAGIRRDVIGEIQQGRGCLELSVAIGAKRTIINGLMCLAQASGLAGDYGLGATLSGATSALVRREGFALPPGFNRYLQLEQYAQSLGVDPASLEEPYEQGEALDLPETLELAFSVVAPGKAEKIAGNKPADRLSPRERELVGLVAAGMTDAQIADTLFISIRTVRSHLDRIRAKTGARRRADLTRLAASLGLPGATPGEDLDSGADPRSGTDTRPPRDAAGPPPNFA